MLPELWSVQETAAYLQCHVETVKRMLRSGELPGIKFGNRWLVPAEKLREALLSELERQSHQRRKEELQ